VIVGVTTFPDHLQGGATFDEQAAARPGSDPRAAGLGRDTDSDAPTASPRDHGNRSGRPDTIAAPRGSLRGEVPSRECSALLRRHDTGPLEFADYVLPEIRLVCRMQRNRGPCGGRGQLGDDVAIMRDFLGIGHIDDLFCIVSRGGRPASTRSTQACSVRLTFPYRWSAK
jgi:hypothetical protein